MSKKYFPSSHEVNKKADKCIRKLAEDGDHASLSAIESCLCRELSVSSLSGIGVRHLEDVPVIREHIKLLNRVAAFAPVFVRVFSIATLDALEECLLEFAGGRGGNGGRGWKTLMLGPLEKIPAVREAFEIPPFITKIRRISTSEVVRHLQDYTSRMGLWSGVVDPRFFCQYLNEQLNVRDNEFLGVKVTSCLLATQSFKKAHRDLESFKTKFRFELQHGLDDMRAQLIGRSSANVGIGLKMRYCQMDSISVINDVLRKYHLLMSAAAYKKLTKGERRLSQVLEQFLELLDVRDNSSHIVIRKLLQTAICASNMESPKDVAKILGIDANSLINPDDGSGACKDGVSSSSAKPSPTVSELTRKFTELTDRCMAQGSMTLSQLTRIEEKLAEYFGFPDFPRLGFGSFLSFLTKQPEPKKVLEHLIGDGMSLVGTSGGSSGSSGETATSKYSHSHAQVLAFIRQCQVNAQSQHKHVEDALCEYHDIADVRALGFGPLDKLVAAAISTSTTSTSSAPTTDRVFYEKALCAKTSSYAGPLLTRARHGKSGQKLVGVMGAMTRDKALKCLRACPPLYDLEEWSHWGRVFEPQFGPLKDFINVGQSSGKAGSAATAATSSSPNENEEIFALESQPGLLLKLPSSSSAEEFGRCVEKLDARAASGQLCHLVTSSFGPSNAPLTLLANHAQAALRKAEANSGPSQSSSQTISNSVKFVFNCLQLLPPHVASATASRVFVEPLGLVVGSALSKKQIVQLAKQPKHLSRIQHLGWLMGIVEWSESFERRLSGATDVLAEDSSFERLDGHANNKNQASSSSPFAPQPSRGASSSPFAPQPSRGASSSPFAPQPSRSSSSPFAPQPVKPAHDDEEEEDDDDGGAVEMLSRDPLSDDDEDDGKAKKDGVGEEAKKDGVGGTESGVEASVPERKLSVKEECRQFIEEIRRDDFGVGVEMSETASKLLAVQQARLGRSLKRLAEDLYSKETHFVLELIQNADDNDYDETVEPALEFIVDGDRILVNNNEKGFRKEDVRAICDIGNSTKGRVKGGYIGQKGIGFKSVFKISDQPEIRSAGFSFKFDSKRGSVGYILPEWVEEEDEDVEMKDLDERKDKDENNDDDNKSKEDSSSTLSRSWNTTIRLPLNSGRGVEIKSGFLDIHPTLLLFLHKLISVRVVDRIAGESVSIERRDVTKGNGQVLSLTTSRTTTMTTTTTTDDECTTVGKSLSDGGQSRITTTVSGDWLLSRKQLPLSELPSTYVTRPADQIRFTELVLAFPLDFDGDNDGEEKEDAGSQRKRRPQSLPIFAFLPLRSYGFDFVIQGDFDVPSSREDLESDSPWNQWLLSHLPDLFVDSLPSFAQFVDGDPIRALEHFLPFLPSTRRVVEEPFSTIAKKIFARLKQIPWIPITTTTPDGDDDAATSPRVCLSCETAVPADPLVRSVITPKLLSKTFGLSYVDEEAERLLRTRPRCDVDILADLGVQTLGLTHLLEVGASIAATEDVDVVSKWLTAVSKMALGGEDDDFLDPKTIEKIRDVRVIPLADGSFVSLLERPVVYFPRERRVRPRDESQRTDVDSRDDDDDNVDDDSSDWYVRELEADISTISSKIFGGADDVDFHAWRLKKLLKECGVKEANPKDVIDDHVLPILRDEEKRSQKSEKTLVSYVVYLKEQWAKNVFDPRRADLRGCVSIATNRGMRNPAEAPIHFGAEYANARVPDLAEEFLSVDWHLLDPVYLADSIPGAGYRRGNPFTGAASTFEITLWRDFFSLLGVTDFVRVDSRRYYLSVADVLQSPDVDVWNKEFGSKGVDEMDVTRDERDSSRVEVEDFECRELESILQATVDASINAALANASSPSSLRSTMQRLFELLESDWTTNFEKFLERKLVYRGKTVVAPSSFARRLLEMEWLPCYHYGKGEPRDGGNNTVEPRQCFLSSGNSYVFVRNTRVINLCADHVPYLVPGTSKDAEAASAFCRFLGLVAAVSVDVVVDLLKSWSSRSSLGEPRRFSTSTAHILGVYNFLREEMPAKQFKELISGGPAVFLPAVAGFKMKTIVDGMFVGGNEVCWMDPSKTFKKYRSVLPAPTGSADADAGDKDFSVAAPTVKYSLHEYYPAVHAKDLFLQAGVPEFPSIDEYLRMLVFVARLSAPAVSPDVLSDVRYVFSAIGQILRRKYSSCLYDEEWDLYRDDLRSKMKHLAIFPTKSRTFISPTDGPFLVDADHLERVFGDTRTVSQRAVDVPLEHLEKDGGSDAQFFLTEVCGFPLLGTLIVDTVKEAKNFAKDKLMIKFLKRLFPILQNYLLSHHSEFYAALMSDARSDSDPDAEPRPSPIIEELTRLKVFRAEMILVEYRFVNAHERTNADGHVVQEEDLVVESVEKAFWSADDGSFWIQRRRGADTQISLLDVCAVIARRMSTDNADVRVALYRFLLRISPALMSVLDKKEGKSDDWERNLLSRFDLMDFPPTETVWAVATYEEEEDDYDDVKPNLSALPKPAVERESGVVLQVGLDANDVISDIASVAGSMPSTVAPRPFKREAAVEGDGPDGANSDVPTDHQRRNEDDAASMASKATYLDDIAEAGSPPTDPDVDGASEISAATRGRQSDVGGDDAFDGTSASLFSATSAASEADRLLAASAAAAAALSASARDDHDSMQMPPPNRPVPKRKWSSKYGENESGSGGGDYEAVAKMKRMGDDDDDDDDANRRILLGLSPDEDDRDLMARQRYFADSAWKFGEMRDRFDDVEYEHVGDGVALRLPETEALMRKTLSGGNDDDGANVEIGRWGEELVYKFLLSRLKKPDSGIVQVSWGNKFGESGMPYDIVVRKQSVSGESEIIYVEVKATRSHHKQMFEISPNEIQFALDQKENYHLFRVFNAGDPERVRIAKIVNVRDQLEKKTVKLCMMI